MEIEILDGAGKGNRAKVNSEGRIHVEAVTLDHITHESIDDGAAYILATGFISLTTTASFSGVLFIKGLDSDTQFHIQRVRICANGVSTGNLQVKFIANATAGTLISDANDAYVTNVNLGSSNTLTNEFSVFNASADGKTVTDGDLMTQVQQSLMGHSHQDYMGCIMIPKDKSLAIAVKPSAACDVCIEILGYKEPKHK